MSTETACPVCAADDDEPCRTATGNPAKAMHKARPVPVLINPPGGLAEMKAKLASTATSKAERRAKKAEDRIARHGRVVETLTSDGPVISAKGAKRSARKRALQAKRRAGQSSLDKGAAMAKARAREARCEARRRAKAAAR